MFLCFMSHSYFNVWCGYLYMSHFLTKQCDRILQLVQKMPELQTKRIRHKLMGMMFWNNVLNYSSNVRKYFWCQKSNNTYFGHVLMLTIHGKYNLHFKFRKFSGGIYIHSSGIEIRKKFHFEKPSAVGKNITFLREPCKMQIESSKNFLILNQRLRGLLLTMLTTT